VWAGQPVDPEGRLIPQEEYAQRLAEWIPTETDRAFVRSLMQPVREPGKMAAWIAPPDRGINNLPVDYEYVRLQ
jgi:benzoyl-CoA 2,3-dioxygenase component B